MKIQILCFSLLLSIADILHAAAVQQWVPKEFKQLADLPPFELANIAAKLSYPKLALFEAVGPLFREVAHQEFKNRLGEAGYLWAKGEITTMPFRAHDGQVAAVFVSADGNIISVGNDDNKVNVWELAGKIYKNIKIIKDAYRNPYYVDFSSATNRLAIAGVTENDFIILDVATGKNINQFESGASIFKIKLSPDGRTLAASHLLEDGIIDLWDVETGKLRQITAEMSGYHSHIPHIDFSPDSQKLVTQSRVLREPIKVWNIRTLAVEKQFSIDAKKLFFGVSFLPDGRLIAYGLTMPQLYGQTKQLLIWDLQTGNLISSLKYTTRGKIGGIVKYKTVSQDGALLAGMFAYQAGDPSKEVMIWHIQSGRMLRRFEAEADVHSIAFSPDGKMLVAGCKDGSIVTWKANPPAIKEIKK